MVLDEAYVDFARENAFSLALELPHVLVARTFSKAYSLCFLRVGYLAGHAALIGALQKIRDSYNVNGLGQAAAVATLGDLPYYRRNFKRLIATRERLSAQLRSLGFAVFPAKLILFSCIRRAGPPRSGKKNCGKSGSWCAGSMRRKLGISCALPSEPMMR